MAKALCGIAELPNHSPLIAAYLREYSAAIEQAADTMLKLHADLKAERQKNRELRELCRDMAMVIKNDDDTFRRLREEARRELSFDFIGNYNETLGTLDQLPLFADRIRKLRVRGVG